MPQRNMIIARVEDMDAVAICEGYCAHDPDEMEVVEAWQHLIDTGLAWRLQGWFGRRAAELISGGICYASTARS